MAKEAASRDGYQNNTEGFEWEDEHMRQAKPGQEQGNKDTEGIGERQKMGQDHFQIDTEALQTCAFTSTTDAHIFLSDDYSSTMNIADKNFYFTK